ncbi:MAG: acyltransferase, partial [Bacteroidota bacterium]|nr:acyltransferase [Bacteroidota bacterium]
YMGLGAGLAWLLWSKKEWLLQLPVFSSKTFQWVLTIFIVLYLCLYMKSPLGDAISPLPMGLLFGWLIVNVAANPNRIFSLENRFLNFMGKISYGLYMYHMPVVYAVSFLFQKSKLATLSPLAYFPLFFGLVFIVTTGIAGGSYYLIEQPLLKKSKRLF